MSGFCRLLTTLAAAWALSPAPAGADANAPAPGPDLTQWTHLAEVRLEAPPARGAVELSLPPEVFDEAREDLGDLRLADAAGQIVPYVLRVDRGQAGRAVPYEPARMFNPVFLPGKQSTVTADFGSRATRTALDVLTPGGNFRRRVAVEASQDGNDWQVLRQADWLFSVAHEGGTFTKSRVALPDNDFRYLRVTVYNAPDDPQRVPVEKLHAWYVKDTPPRTADVATRSVTATQRPKAKATEIEADLGFRKLPLHDVEMAFEETDFLRRVEVLGRDRKTSIVMESIEDAPPRKREVQVPWTPLATGTIHRFSSPQGRAESAGLRLPVEGRCRYLLVRIHNGDNAPLHFTGLTARRLQHHLAFQPTGGGPFRLYLGRADAAAPRYDLVHFISRLRAEGVTPASLGSVRPNPLYAPAERVIPWSERYRWLLWVVLVAVLAVLAALVLRQARRAPRADSDA